MADKCIILLLDGTWNDADVGVRDTNIVRLRQIIAASLDREEPAPEEASTPAAKLSKGQMVTSRTYLGNRHIVFYERGVGTGWTDWLRGGAFGRGLDNNIRRAYKFLSHHYEPGDKVFIFGFSRGAYTARSLAGFIAAAGLLRQKYCSSDNESLAWSYYRTPPNDRLPGVWAQLEPIVHDRDAFAIECVGVFDTVGALGVPLKSFWKFNRQRYEFHDVELSSIVKVSLHAVALDEHRYPFQAAVWRKPQFKRFRTVTEQVWFPGAHADVGGSYIDETRRPQHHKMALDDIPLDWMLRRVKDHYPGFPFDPNGAWKSLRPDWAQARAHEARRNIYRLWPTAQRVPANLSRRPRRWLYESVVCHDRHLNQIGEMVHISVLLRLGQFVLLDGRYKRYLPWNLLSVLPDIERTYDTAPGTARPELAIRIVGWSGRPLEPDNDADRQEAMGLIRQAYVQLGLRPTDQTTSGQGRPPVRGVGHWLVGLRRTAAPSR